MGLVVVSYQYRPPLICCFFRGDFYSNRHGEFSCLFLSLFTEIKRACHEIVCFWQVKENNLIPWGKTSGDEFGGARKLVSVIWASAWCRCSPPPANSFSAPPYVESRRLELIDQRTSSAHKRPSFAEFLP